MNWLENIKYKMFIIYVIGTIFFNLTRWYENMQTSFCIYALL